MMKMMSSTNITSTKGVILISFITSSLSSWVPKAMVYPLAFTREPVINKACRSWAKRFMRVMTDLLPRTKAL